MLQMVRLGQQYLNLAHVLGVTFGLHQWEDAEGAHEVALAIVEMAGRGGVDGGSTIHRFYGATALTLRAWLDERSTVIAEEAEACPEPVWALESGQPLAEDDDGVWDEGAPDPDPDEAESPLHARTFGRVLEGMADLRQWDGEEG